MSERDGASGGSCFIATAAFGSRLHPYVETLRGFRDSYLLSNAPGRKLAAFYYKYSPPVTDFVDKHAALKYLTRLLLIPFIAFSTFMLYVGLMMKLFLLLALVVAASWAGWWKSNRSRRLTISG